MFFVKKILLLALFQFYQKFSSSESKAQKAPRPPRQPDVRDYQFFPPDLFVLLDREVQCFRKQMNYKGSLVNFNLGQVLIEHIEPKCSLESKQYFVSMCSKGLLTLTWDKKKYFLVPIDNTLEHPKKAQKEAQAKIDDAVELSEDELRKCIELECWLIVLLGSREEMLTQGFTNWSKRDFVAFIRVSVIYRENLKSL